MGYERDEAMRQQDATEAMIRMREPRRPSDGPFMPCPAKWNVTYKSRPVEGGALHTLTIQGGGGTVIDMFLGVDENGSQDGDFNMVGPDGGVNLPSEVRMVMGRFLSLDFEGIEGLVKLGAIKEGSE